MTGILQSLLGSVSSAVAVVTDAYFNLVTLLLPGNGTNGAQNNTFLDSGTANGGVGFTITRNGDTTQGTFSPFSQTGWSNYFDGTSGQYLNTVANTAFNFGTGDFTVETWVYPTSTSGTRPIIEIRTTGGANGFALLSQSGALTLNVYTNSAFAGASTNSMTLNAWNHVALTRSGNTWTYWINGASGGSFTNSSTQSDGGTTGPKIGGSSTAGEVWIGYISNARITKGGALYSSTFTPSTTPLTTTVSAGTVSLLTCQSNRFIDNSSNAFAITVNGTPSVQAFSPFAPTAAYSAATNGGSGYFDGSGDYLNSTITAFGSGNFTIECWVYFTASVASKGIFHVATSSALPSTVSGVALASGASGGWSLYYNNGSQNTTATLTAAQNTWIHLAVVKSGTTIRVYVDGVMNQSQADTANYTSQVAAIGGFYSTAYLLTGYISGFKVTSTADYSGTSTTTANFTLPTAPPSPTSSILCCNFTNAGITDATAKNDLETVGNAQISTTQSKFGGSSMSFDGTGDYLLTYSPTNTNAFGTGDFTIEMWFYVTTTASAQILIDFRPTGTDGLYPMIYVASGGGSVRYNVSNADQITGTTTISTSTWYHFALSRSGTSTRMFINGTQVGSTYTDSNNYLVGANRPVIGAGGSSVGATALNGYIDDLRISKVARYTSNFTAPTAAFPVQ